MRGGVLFLAFFSLGKLHSYFRGRQGLGLGDVKLAGVAGAWLDWLAMPIAVEIAALAALSVYVLRQLILGKPLSATNRIPFGVFFAPAIWGCWLLQTMVLLPPI
jgi:leader peptidase (prepilin peptidase)/N-methyltransferase